MSHITLHQYIVILQEIDEIDDRLMRLEDKQVNPRIPILSDMPRGGGGDFDKFGNYLIKVEALEGRRNKMYKQIESVDQRLNDNERALIRCRYIEDLKWQDVAMRLKIKLRQVFRIHNSILEKFEKN